MRSVLSAVLAAAVATVLAGTVALVPCPAWAHAGLVDSSPRDGATLDALPSEVTLTFTEDITAPAYVVVRGPGGTALAEGEAVVEGPLVRQAVEPGEPGEHTLAYSVVSADGHRVTGELTFTVEGGGETPPASPDAAESPEASPTPDATAPAEPAPSPTDTGGASAPAEDDEGFLAANSGLLLLLGAGLLLVVGIVVVAARRRRAE